MTFIWWKGMNFWIWSDPCSLNASKPMSESMKNQSSQLSPKILRFYSDKNPATLEFFVLVFFALSIMNCLEVLNSVGNNFYPLLLHIPSKNRFRSILLNDSSNKLVLSLNSIKKRLLVVSQKIIRNICYIK